MQIYEIISNNEIFMKQNICESFTHIFYDI